MSVWDRITSTLTARKYHGLQNQGATCYLNSVLQVLFMTKDFREAVTRNGGKDESFQTDLKNLFERLEKGESDTRDITASLGILSGRKQGDAAECLENILNSLHNEEASQIFKISLTHKNFCLRCGEGSATVEQSWHLPIELVEEGFRVFKVADGVAKFFCETEVTGQDKLYCEKCGEKTDSHDKLEMKTHPDVLTLLLKRFKFDRLWNDYVKIHCKVDIPYRITVEGQKYELYAFVEHGGDLKVGHYVVTIKSEANEKWYRFSDTVVNLLHYDPWQLDPSYGSRGAYLLFYRKEKKTSPPDEAPPPAGLTPGTSADDDRSGNAVKVDECEEATEDRQNDPGSEGEGATEETFTQERVVPGDKGGSTTVRNLNMYDLAYSRHYNAATETKHKKDNREAQQEDAERINGFYKDDDLARVGFDRRNGRKVKDESSGQDQGPESRVMRARQHGRGEEESDSHKANAVMRSQVELCLQRCHSERRAEIEGDDERALRGDMPRKREARMRDTVEEKDPSKAAGMESLTGSFANMNLEDSTSAKKSDKSTQTLHINVSFPSTVNGLDRNPVHSDMESRYRVTNVFCGNCQSVTGILQTDTYSNTHTFTPMAPLALPGSQPAFAENQTTYLTHTPTYTHVHDHQHSNASGNSVITTLYHYLPCKRHSGQGSE